MPIHLGAWPPAASARPSSIISENAGTNPKLAPRHEVGSAADRRRCHRRHKQVIDKPALRRFLLWLQFVGELVKDGLG